MPSLVEYPTTSNWFRDERVARRRDGIMRYGTLPACLTELLDESAQRYAAREAVVEIGGPRLTYAQLWASAAPIGGGLLVQGVSIGDRVAIRMPNGVRFVQAFLGVLAAGGVQVPVNSRFSDAEAAYVVADCGAVLTLDGDLPEGLPFIDDGTGHDDLAVLLYTSGTTGPPKGVELSNENLLSTIESMIHSMGLTRDGVRNLLGMPLFHVTGCNLQLLPTLAVGGTLVIQPRFDADEWLRTITEERIDLLTASPAVYRQVLARPGFTDVDTSGIRWLRYDGAATTPAQVARLRDAFPVGRLCSGWGMTETAGAGLTLPHDCGPTHSDSAGVPWGGMEIALSGESAGESVGELLCRGPNLMRRYWGDPEATAARFTGQWFRTGDIARIDADGFVRIVDRVGDVIVCGGEHVYSVEVEHALLAHPDIAEVAVLGVPDPALGETVGAVLVPAPGADLDTDAVLAFARERVTGVAVPQRLYPRTEPLPRNAYGRIDKAALRSAVNGLGGRTRPCVLPIS